MQKKSMNRNIAYSIAFSLLAKGLSFFQSIVVSWQYGAGRSTDILYFAVAFIVSCTTICNTINQHVIIPNYIRMRDLRGEKEAMRFANLVFTIYVVLGILAVLFIFLFPVPVYTGLSKFGAEALLQNRQVLQITAPMLLLMIVNMLITDLFTAYKHFTMPMVVDMIKSGIVIVATLLPWAGGSVANLALAMLAANLLQFVFLIFALFLILKWKPQLGKVQLEKKVGANVFYVILGQVVVFFANILVMNLISGFADGVYTSMEYAQKVNTVIASVIITQLTTIIGIQIIEHYNENQLDKLSSVFSNYMRGSFYVIAPICFALSLCAKPLMSLLFERGRFGAEAAGTSAGFFSVFILIIPFNLLGEFINRLVIAHQMQRLSVIWKIVLNIFMMLCLFVFVRWQGFLGAPLGQLAAYALYTAFLFIVLKKYFPYIQNEKEIVIFLCKCIGINIVLRFGLEWIFGGLLAAETMGEKILAVVVCGGTYVIAYLCISVLPGMFNGETKQLIAGFKEKRAARAK